MSEIFLLTLCLVVGEVVSTSGSCIRSAICPCGTSGKTYTFCVDDIVIHENPCDRWSQCETCREGYPYCVTCPEGRLGGLCSTVRKPNRKKRQNDRQTDAISGRRATNSRPRSQLTREKRPDVFCVAQEPISNGRTFRKSGNQLAEVNYENFELVPVGTQMLFECYFGYTMVGESSSNCTSTGFWSSEIPICNKGSPSEVPVMCVELDAPDNGKAYRILDPQRPPELITDDSDEMEFPVGTMVEYSCDLGYILKGPEAVICRRGGLWSADDIPECEQDCGKTAITPTSKITRGNKTEAGEWPWMVSISEPSGNNFTNLICGGVLLGPRTVLTAAHCFVSDPSYFVLHFGKLYRRNINNDGVEERRITKDRHIKIHPQFNKSTYANDIALVKLDREVQFTKHILPICLPTFKSSRQNLAPRRKGIVTGWGMDELELPTSVLMMAELPVQSFETCSKYFEEMTMDSKMWPDVFCAGHPNGKISACRGDSGSPIVFLDKKTQKYTLEGCVSHSARGQCDLEGRYTVFTKVSKFLNWIYSYAT